jgi:inosine/xanthosine triphosphatase
MVEWRSPKPLIKVRILVGPHMKIVAIASTNPVKIEVAKRACAAVFPDETFEFIPLKSESGVPDQPMDEEGRRGARNRLAFIKKQRPDADYWISQEGSLFRDGEKLASRAWIAAMDASGFVTESSTASFVLPEAVEKEVRGGLELGHAIDKVFNTTNSKHGEGAIWYLTDGLINRTEYYLPAAIIALSGLKHREWYS